jgi:ElaB/YqjD/DUF883 family membrane-anchored ribosome-binding protein
MSEAKTDETIVHNGAAPAHEDDASHETGAHDQGANGETEILRGLRESARATTDALRDAYRGATAAMSDLSEEACQIGSRTSAQISRQVEAQPMTSVLVAASIGLIAGVLLARR